MEHRKGGRNEKRNEKDDEGRSPMRIREWQSGKAAVLEDSFALACCQAAVGGKSKGSGRKLE